MVKAWGQWSMHGKNGVSECMRLDSIEEQVLENARYGWQQIAPRDAVLSQILPWSYEMCGGQRHCLEAQRFRVARCVYRH